MRWQSRKHSRPCLYFGEDTGQDPGLRPSGAAVGYATDCPKSLYKNAVQAGFKSGLALGEELFQQIIDHPEGIWVGKLDPDNNFAEVKPKTANQPAHSGAD